MEGWEKAPVHASPILTPLPGSTAVRGAWVAEPVVWFGIVFLNFLPIQFFSHPTQQLEEKKPTTTFQKDCGPHVKSCGSS